MLRLAIGRKMDVSRMFAIWRIDSPWQPVTRKGQGQRMGGGKGAIDHYVTPIKAGKNNLTNVTVCVAVSSVSAIHNKEIRNGDLYVLFRSYSTGDCVLFLLKSQCFFSRVFSLFFVCIYAPAILHLLK